ncbi:MAG: bifunctional phosphopantothenoylcysteine decarboxylase/phosphopantothenate synthase, partial [Alphaproteobacteria bacterium]|nr:bifunctional phosphopantothenoylcysteine decarboxylase/phosphopantothenate synthase [Alphaproteobacteria bacterium]
PPSLPTPDFNYVKLIRVETAGEMLKACESVLPVDIAVCAAAVSDWTPEQAQSHKIKKTPRSSPPSLTLKENPDILRTLGAHKHRPRLLVGFAAETENLLENAAAKRESKNCDWILANEIAPGSNIFGAEENHVYLITRDGVEDWRPATKTEIAGCLSDKIIGFFEKEKTHAP